MSQRKLSCKDLDALKRRMDSTVDELMKLAKTWRRLLGSWMPRNLFRVWIGWGLKEVRRMKYHVDK